MTPTYYLPSPCVSVCEIDPDTRYCRGCLRTTEEISAWRNLDYDARLVLLDRLRERRSEVGLPTRRTSRRRALRRSLATKPCDEMKTDHED